MAHRIAVIGGDGIGPEVTAEALGVVRAAGVDIETRDFDLGGARYLRENAGYHAAKDKQGHMEGRIRQLEHLLENAE
ncbi:MAG: hypothetical protein EBV88_04920, partial [Actinobacteria bacterium]|nr:hypothetical protein [Actinomycetota bacterium]